MNKRTKILIVILMTGLSARHSAKAGIRVDFDRDNQTYNWITGVNYAIRSPGFDFRTSFNGQSNLIKGAPNRWQENATADFQSEVSIASGFRFLTAGDYTINGLNRRRVRSSDLALGFAYRPWRILELKPMVHADNKKRSELEAQLDDQGIGYGMVANLLPFQYRSLFMDAGVSYDRTNLTNIPSEVSAGYLHSTFSFRNSDTVYVSLLGSETSKKYYGPGGDIQSITRQIKQEREGNFIVSVALPADLRLKFDGDAQLTKFLYRENLVQDATSAQRDNSGRGEGYELTLSGRVRERAFYSAIYRWSNASQDYQGVTLDQDTDTGEMAFHGTLILSDKDSLSGDFVMGVTSFTNPNRGFGLDDWDKKTILANGQIDHTFSPYFSMGLTGGASSFHQVYISGARSANNGLNDTYILSPYSLWKPLGWLDIRQSFDIQANYITFDFDRKKVSTKNRIFRRASTKSELFVKITDRLRMRQVYFYRYEDYGQLIWDDGWQQAVSWDRRRHGIETEFDYDISGIVFIKPYFFWEKTGDYDFKVEAAIEEGNEPEIIRTLRDEQVKMIYKFELAFRWDPRRSFLFNISHRLRKFMDRPRETNNYVKVSMEYLF